MENSPGPRGPSPKPPQAPPREEGEKRRAKCMSYNRPNSTLENRAAITTDEKEEPNARAAKASRGKPERRGSTQ